jgi:hypothetical protein
MVRKWFVFTGDDDLDSPIVQPLRSERAATIELVELRRRMKMPQRHRLLHGYPQAAAMPKRQGLIEFPFRDLEFGSPSDRGLLVGVLPHPFCNPALAGCGFCTFPHEAFNARKSQEVVDAVIREIKGRVRKQRNLRRRAVTALYFCSFQPDKFEMLGFGPSGISFTTRGDENSPLWKTSAQADRAVLSWRSSESGPRHMG